MGQWFQKFIASSIYGEVSDATIQGYLRSASQIEEVWQQIDDDVDALILQGMAPWDAYARMGHALAFVRACRTNIVFVQELLKAYTTAKTGDAHYLPRVTYDQALALCEHIEPYLEEAIKASSNPDYVPASYSLPLPFGPHIRGANPRFPLPHLQGIIGAAQQMRDWAAGLLAKYELALDAARLPVPPTVSAHREQMKGELRLGDFHLRTGTDMVGQISQGQVTDELSDKAEGFLWEAMESFFKVSQLVANPALHARPAYKVSDTENYGQHYHDKQNFHQEPIRRTPAPPDSPTPQVSPAPALAPTEPDVADLFNAVIAEPDVTQRPAEQPSPNVSQMLNQMVAEPETSRNAPAQPAPDVSNMLNQVIATPGAVQETPAPPVPDAPDLLSQVISGPDTIQNTSNLPAQKRSPLEDHKKPPNEPAAESSVLDLLSEVCGEQQDTNRQNQ
jgi:hypothetical protein